MSLIVDGHNLIPAIPGMSLSMLDDEDHLIELLVNYTRVTGKKIIVYFDKAPPGAVKFRQYGSVGVHFVREGFSADAAIFGKLKQLGRGAKNWTVVSSDKSVQSDARSVGAGVISSEEFARTILSAVEETGERPGVSREVYPDDAEVDEWLGLFRGGLEDDPQ